MKTYKKTIAAFRVVKEPTNIHAVKIKSSQDAAYYFKQLWDVDTIPVYESFYILTLNRANITNGYTMISRGSTSGTVVDIKMICNFAAQNLASSVIVAHNHPSGNKEFSVQDIEVSKKIKTALSFMDIQLIDSIVLTEESHSSMADKGQL
jgi:DNA repair protein RadC